MTCEFEQPVRRRARRMLHAAAAVVVLLLGMFPARVCGASIDGTIMQASSAGDHVWLLIERDVSSDADSPGEPPWRVYYHRPVMGFGSFAPVRTMGTAPDHILASGSSLYLLTERDDPAAGLDVFSVTIAHNATFDVYFTRPSDRMELHEALPACRVIAMTGHDAGPLVLVRPLEQPPSDALAEPALLQLRSGTWQNVPLPERFDVSRPARLLTGATAGQPLLLLQPAGDQENATRVDTSDGSGTWTSRVLDLPFEQLAAVTQAGNQVAAAWSADPGDDAVSIGYLRSNQVIDLATATVGEQPWHLLGTSESLLLLRASAEGRWAITKIDMVSGSLGAAQELRVHATLGARFWIEALLLAGAVSAALLIVLIRPAPKHEIELPKPLAVLPPMRRLAALLIDAFPAAVLTWLLTRCTMAELLQAPLITSRLVMSTPYMLLIGLTLAHSTVSEVLTGTTLGKSMVGAKVVGLDGQRPGIAACLLRAFGKAITLLVLPAAMFGLLNRNVQGVDDLLARTLVVHEPDEQPSRAEGDR